MALSADVSSKAFMKYQDRAKEMAEVTAVTELLVREVEGGQDPAEDPGGSEIGLKVVRPLWQDLQDELMLRFETITIEALCERAEEMSIPSEAAEIYTDFSI